MNRSIRRLSPETASRIAAGEVIERPLSALKEVVENALDAGARAIEVRIEGTLDASFQVADDGIGIAAGDLELALERHATSKITRLEDLDRLASLGFRGEALPSIAAVSRLRITSRPRESAAAAFVSLEAGAVIDRGDAARAPGTTVEVAELFFNTPARRKFLHSPTGERRAAVRMLECYALAFPEVAFRLVVDGRTRFDWPASRNTRAGEGANGAPSGAVPPDPAACRERATALWGVRHAEQLLEVSAERDGVRLDALLGLPEHGRATREGQVFLVNRRWIQSPMLGQALRNAYGNLLATGRFPSATLWLTVPPERLDVNVHPTKREVRLADEGTVFALVAGACAQVLTHLHPPFTVVRGGQTAEPRWAERIAEPPPDQTYLGFENAPRASGAEPGLDSPPPPTGLPLRPASEAIADVGEPELWQLHRTYILAPLRNGLVLIDQHAAHERVLYEAARARLEGERGAAQQLLFPAIIDLSRSQFELLLELGPWLKQLGWDLAPLGPPSVVVHGVPADVQQRPAGEMLQDVLDGVSESSGRTASEDISEHLARSYACHAAVRAGDPLTQAEMKALVDRLFATSRPHGDPHGRVTYVRIEMDELHRRFGRS